MHKIIRKIFKILNNKTRKQFGILVILMFFAMVLETIGIGSMIPLINYFTGESILLPYNMNLNQIFLNLGIPKNYILNFILILIIAIFLIKNIYLGLYAWIESKFAQKVRFNLGVKLFNKYLYSPYKFHLSNNSSNLITKINQETAFYGNVLIKLSQLLTEIFVIVGLTIFLLLLKTQETLIIIIIGFITSSIFYFGFANIVSWLGKKRQLSEKAKMKSLNQGLSAIKDVIFYKVQRKFIDIFQSDSDDMCEATFKIIFIQKLPKVWFEMVTIVIITFIIFFLSSKQIDTSTVMATIGLFLITSIRIIPSINKIIYSLQEIKYAEASLDSLLIDLDSTNLKSLENNQMEETNNKIEFQNEIKFNNVFFNYVKSDKPVLKNVNLTIKKNEFVGIVGETGSGKSTLVDLLIGLMEPNEGTITVDGKNINKNLNSWKKNLGYVSQNLYLLDESIKNNIAFGYKDNEIDKVKVENSIEKSQLSKFINNLKNGLDSKVGERGVKISGGERQRIGIARALYNDPEILVFDEATSALDLDTEKKLLETLIKFKKNKTFIFITHRTSGLSYCDRIFKIENSEIKEIQK